MGSRERLSHISDWTFGPSTHYGQLLEQVFYAFRRGRFLAGLSINLVLPHPQP